jgi:dienelactone hydrolase
VIVMAEMPGIYAHFLRFARMVRDAGFTVWIPALFGTRGGPVTIAGGLTTMVRACMSREFRAFAANASSPVTQWLRALAAHAHPLCGGKGVGAIGMCFTGNFALSMMLEPAMLAPVLSQPSLPMFSAGGMHIAPDELAAVKARMEREDLTVLAYRFAGDRFCRAERFAQYEAALGDRFQSRVLPDSAALPGTPVRPHSVVTLHLVDRAGEPTRAAVDEILAFFASRLRE